MIALILFALNFANPNVERLVLSIESDNHKLSYPYDELMKNAFPLNIGNNHDLFVGHCDRMDYGPGFEDCKTMQSYQQDLDKLLVISDTVEYNGQLITRSYCEVQSVAVPEPSTLLMMIPLIWMVRHIGKSNSFENYGA